jgi:thymidine kinase
MRERLSVIAGSMYSGKTEEIIRELTKAKYGEKIIQVFNSIVDTRQEPDIIKSHSGSTFPAKTVKDSNELLENVKPDTQLVAIDEAQFFDKGLPDVVEKLVDRGVAVLIGGLPTDFRGEGFGPMPILLARADSIARLKAVCRFHDENGKVCGDAATRTQRFVNGKPASYNDPIVVVGAEELYEARCPAHHIVLDKPNK